MKIIDLNTTSSENTFYHFTNRENYESISLYGLIPSIGNNARGIELTNKVFFSKGNLGFLRICDVWINWFIYRNGLYDSVFKYKNITQEEIINLKRKFKEDFMNGLFYTEENINKAFSWMNSFMSSNIVLKLDLSSEDYEQFDIDEAKSHEKIDFIKKMYLGYVTSDSYTEEFNMHTKSGIGVSNDKISKIVVSNDDSAISILKEIYSLEKDKNYEFTFLDDFMRYVYSIDSNINYKKRK